MGARAVNMQVLLTCSNLSWAANVTAPYPELVLTSARARMLRILTDVKRQYASACSSL